MKVAVVAPSPVPFRIGGAERLCDGLTRAINDLTEHSADLVKLPAPEMSFRQLIESYRAFAQLDLSHFDLVIATKYPSWMVSHPNKIVYLLHALRGLYDTYPLTGEPEQVLDPPREIEPLLKAVSRAAEGGEPALRVIDSAEAALAALGDDHPALRFPGPVIRQVVQALDRVALRHPETRRHFSISRTVAARGYFPPGSVVTALYPPADLANQRTGDWNHLFTSSRLDRPKRLDLLIEAYRTTDVAIPLRIAGEGDEAERLRHLAGDDPRVELLGRVDDARLVDLYADAAAVPFVPYDEDFGLVTVEAFNSGKPVITCTDSGGPVELVRHGVNGLVVEPDVESLSKALRDLGGDIERCRSMGPAALATAAEITWEAVSKELTSTGGGSLPIRRSPPDGGSRSRRPLAVFLSTYPFYPSESGGPIRGARLAESLTETFDVEVWATARTDQAPRTTTPAPRVIQHLVRLDEADYRMRDDWSRGAGWVPIEDIAAGLTVGPMSSFARAVRPALRSATLVVLSHPYLVGTLEDLTGGRVRVVYDAVDMELQQKADSIGEAPAGPLLMRAVETMERRACRVADAVTAAADTDAAALADAYRLAEPVVVIPNGADTASTAFVPEAQRRANTKRWLGRYASATGRAHEGVALFVASWHPPNLRAARDLLDMAAEVREVLIALGGFHSEYFAEWLVPPNVVRLGRLSRAALGGLLSAGSVALNPMTMGAGTNLKMLQYWAAGIPTISTPFGARGLDAVAGDHYIVADIDGFPAAITAVVSGETPTRTMTVAARRLVEDSYDWEVISRRFRKLVGQLVPA